MLGVVREEPVVEDLPGHRVEAQVGLVEEGDLGARGQADDDPTADSFPRESFLIAASSAAGSRRRADRRAPRSSSGRTTTPTPARAGPSRRGRLTLPHEAHPPEHFVVLVGMLAEDAHVADGGESWP